MRLLILRDPLIPARRYEKVMAEFSLIYTTVGITPVFHLEDFDYSHYPVVNHSGDAQIIDKQWLRKQTDAVYARWAEEVDHVVFLIHEDNWRLDGVWGWNLSGLYNGYQVQICRFDRDNNANSLGTLYHEVHHSHDAMVSIYLGKRVEPIVGVRDWDDDVTHGAHKHWKYIRHRENTLSVAMIAPLLQKAYKKRVDIFNTKVSMMRRIINLAEQVIVLQRALLAKRNKDKPCR